MKQTTVFSERVRGKVRTLEVVRKRGLHVDTWSPERSHIMICSVNALISYR